jgi:hypothetical protein
MQLQLNQSGKSSSKDLIKFFKFPNATYLTARMFNQLEIIVEQLEGLIDNKKTFESIDQQYSLLYALNILGANFQAL